MFLQWSNSWQFFEVPVALHLARVEFLGRVVTCAPPPYWPEGTLLWKIWAEIYSFEQNDTKCVYLMWIYHDLPMQYLTNVMHFFKMIGQPASKVCSIRRRSSCSSAANYQRWNLAAAVEVGPTILSNTIHGFHGPSPFMPHCCWLGCPLETAEQKKHHLNELAGWGWSMTKPVCIYGSR